MTGLGSLFQNLTKRTHRKCAKLNSRIPVSDRQERIEGWDQAALARSKILLIGAGGINGLIGLGAVKKGIGQIAICDHDIVAPENLNRQFFDEASSYNNKAVELIRKLAGEGFLGTELFAHPCSFQELDLSLIRPDVIVCGVDKQISGTRLDVCKFALSRGIPAVFAAVSRNADAGTVIVQAPGEACWECIQKSSMDAPQAELSDGDARCPGTPASIDILMLVAGYALYAIDSLLMKRPRNWNFIHLSLSRPDSNMSVWASRREDCIACGSPAEGA